MNFNSNEPPDVKEEIEGSFKEVTSPGGASKACKFGQRLSSFETKFLACTEIGINYWNNRIVSVIGEFKLCVAVGSHPYTVILYNS